MGVLEEKDFPTKAVTIAPCEISGREFKDLLFMIMSTCSYQVITVKKVNNGYSVTSLFDINEIGGELIPTRNPMHVIIGASIIMDVIDDAVCEVTIFLDWFSDTDFEFFIANVWSVLESHDVTAEKRGDDYSIIAIKRDLSVPRPPFELALTDLGTDTYSIWDAKKEPHIYSPTMEDLLK